MLDTYEKAKAAVEEFEKEYCGQDKHKLWTEISGGELKLYWIKFTKLDGVFQGFVFAENEKEAYKILSDTHPYMVKDYSPEFDSTKAKPGNHCRVLQMSTSKGVFWAQDPY